MSEKKLGDKEKMFCKEFIVDFNGTRAAKAAGYSHNSARTTASDNLAKPYIKEYISKLLEPRMKKLDINADRVGQELAAIAYARLCDVGEWDEKGVLTLMPSEKIPDFIQPAIKSIERIVTETGVRLKITMHSKEKALEMLAKHTKFFEDAAPETTNNTTNIFLDGLAPERVKRIIEILDEEEKESG